MEKVEFSEEQQKFVDELVGTARVKAREKAQSDFEAQTAKAKTDSEKAALAAEQKWKELAEVHAARVQELEPLSAQVQAYTTLIEGMLKDRMKALGDAAKKAVGALPEAMSPLEKLSWLNQNEALFKASGDGVGTPPRPRPVAQTETPKRKKIKYHL